MAGDGDNRSVEEFFNDLASEQNGTKRDLRVRNVLQPLEGYHISDQELGTTSYYGYLNADGAWFIRRSVISSSETTHTYAAGSSGYDWANRVAESYNSFSATF